MTDDDHLYVDCEKHGRGIAAVVCRHLCDGADTPLGFIENSTVPGDLQAWCHACEDCFEEEGGMTETFKAFNHFALVCEACYANIKSTHSQATQ